jgi:hypothetical protein
MSGFIDQINVRHNIFSSDALTVETIDKMRLIKSETSKPKPFKIEFGTFEPTYVLIDADLSKYNIDITDDILNCLSSVLQNVSETDYAKHRFAKHNDTLESKLATLFAKIFTPKKYNAEIRLSAKVCLKTVFHLIKLTGTYQSKGRHMEHARAVLPPTYLNAKSCQLRYK